MPIQILKGGKVLPPKNYTEHPATAVVKSSESATGAEKQDIIHPSEMALLTTEPVANVGVRADFTMNLGNYNSAKMGVSLNLPSLTDDASLDETFKKGKRWVNAKLEELVKETQAANPPA